MTEFDATPKTKMYDTHEEIEDNLHDKVWISSLLGKNIESVSLVDMVQAGTLVCELSPNDLLQVACLGI